MKSLLTILFFTSFLANSQINTFLATNCVGQQGTYASTGFLSGDWDWGDGFTQTGSLSWHTYFTPGTYWLVFTSGLVVDSLEMIIGDPTSNFTFSALPNCNEYSFLDSSYNSTATGPIVAWQWNFGNGIGSSSQQDTAFTFPNSGNFSVQLTITDSLGCQVTTEKPITVGDPSILSISSSASCPCNDIQFNSVGSATSFIWDFGDGNTSTASDPLYTYSYPGNYLVSATGTDGSGCDFQETMSFLVCPNDILPDTAANKTWYFGATFGGGVGFDFNTGSPPTLLTGGFTGYIPLTGTPSPFMEGTSSVSHRRTGALLFYTNGQDVYDNTNTIMTNGGGMNGNASSTESSVIIPFPGDTNKYYIFTNGGHTGGPNDGVGIYYSVVDMTLNGGLGDVTGIKNVFVVDQDSSESIIATTMLRCDKKEGYWAISHNGNEYFSIPITENGVGVLNTFSIGGGAYAAPSNLGYGSAMSPLGNKIAIFHGDGIEITDFDRTTGVISNAQTFYSPTQVPFQGSYDMNFSPDGTKLFVNDWQMDITNPSILGTTIQYRFADPQVPNPNGAFSKFNGPDGKMYVARFQKNVVAVATSPNSYGPAVNYDDNAYSLGSNICSYGMQNLQEPFVLDNPNPDSLFASFSDSILTNCTDVLFTNTSDTLTPPPACSFFANESLVFTWDFGDASPPVNGANPAPHTYPGPGTYTVELILSRPFVCYADTFTMNITVPNPPTASIVAIPNTICLGDSSAITVSGGNTYFWSTGQIGNIEIFTPPFDSTIYAVAQDLNGCEDTAYISITVIQPDTVNAASQICPSDSLFIGGAFQTTAGVYFDNFINTLGCDSVVSTTLSFLPLSTGTATATICPGGSIMLGGSLQTTAGVYNDTIIAGAFNGCDSIVQTTLTVLPLSTGTATASICPGGSIMLGGSLQTTAGVYNDTIIAGGFNGCDSIVQTTLIILPLSTGTATATICPGGSIMLGGSLQTTAGVYTDTIIAGGFNGCDSIVQTTLTILPLSNGTATATICPGGSIMLGGSLQTTAGVYTDTIIAGAFNGCDSIVQTTLTVLPIATSNSTQTICQGDSLLINGNYETVAGVYSDTLTAAGVNGCDSVAQVTLIVDPLSDATITAVSPICDDNGILSLTAASTTGTWTGTGITDPNLGTFDPSISGSGTFTITYSITGSCPDVDSIQLTVNPSPTTTSLVTDDNCLEEIGSIDVTISGGTSPYSYTWDNGEITEDLTGLLAGTYIITVSDNNSCTATETITVSDLSIDCQYHVYVPNIFSPDANGQNDELYVRGKGVSTMLFIVYNRWGQKVFESSSMDFGWDGVYRGKAVDAGVFVYMLTGTFVNGEAIDEKGNITIVR
jgi:gliding motility-associated-like protein